MTQREELDSKKILRDYHADLMKIRDTYLRVPNSEPGKKNQAAQEAGMDLMAKISDFDLQYGSQLR